MPEWSAPRNERKAVLKSSTTVRSILRTKALQLCLVSDTGCEAGAARRAPARASNLEPLPAHIAVSAQLGRGAVELDLAMAHDDAAV